MKLRWLICILISLAIHVVWLSQSNLTKQSQAKSTVPPITIAQAEPVHPPPARPMPQPKPEEIKKDAEAQSQKFRPNIEKEEPEKDKVQEATQKPPETEENEPEVTTQPKEKLAQKAPVEKADFKEETAQYRKQLFTEFKDNWQKVPELNTTIKDLTLLPKIDAHFGVKILAYSFVDSKPGPPFIIFNISDDTYQKVDSFDFSVFSNRVKDRMLYTQYREKLEKARQQYKINSLMKVIGLVPAETDHYFSVKQLRAVQLAGVNLDQVTITNAHYEPNGTDGFNLIIDNVVTTTGRTIPIRDEELKFSIVAMK